MTTTALVWFVIGLLSVAAVLALLVALIRHLIVLGRATRRFQEEVTPLAQEISALSDRTSTGSRARSRRPHPDR